MKIAICVYVVSMFNLNMSWLYYLVTILFLQVMLMIKEKKIPTAAITARLFLVNPLTSLSAPCVNMASTCMFVCVETTEGWGRVNTTIPHYKCNIHKNVCTQHKNGVCMLLWAEGEGMKKNQDY